MPTVVGCDASECAFNNNNQCSAHAINVGGPQDHCPKCDTFFKRQSKGGNSTVTAGVGACKVQMCEYNQAFDCTAKSIRVTVHQQHADCATYQDR